MCSQISGISSSSNRFAGILAYAFLFPFQASSEFDSKMALARQNMPALQATLYDALNPSCSIPYILSVCIERDTVWDKCLSQGRIMTLSKV